MKKTSYLIAIIVIVYSCSPNGKDVSKGQELFSFLKNETKLRFDFDYFNNSKHIKYIKTFNNDGTQVVSSYNFSDKDLYYFKYKFPSAKKFILTVKEGGESSIEGVPFIATKLEDNPNNLYCSFANPFFIETTVTLISNQELEPLFVKILSLESHALMIDLNGETNLSIIIEMRNESDKILFNKTYNLADFLASQRKRM